ncbi:MAG: hypothetical protein K0Q95_1195 [Bacteroidota bacterium]|jgi:hypothetical protein|nr:hypothetical protein [Bacteroidota bacterium]
MSQAFVKEGDDQWLHDIQPTMTALVHYLTKENGGIRIYEKKSYFSKEHGREVHEMNDGLTYAINDEGKWYIVDL